MPEATVVVIGGGAAGLSAAGALAQRGIDAVVLEQDPEVGGTWARRYDRLHLHTVRGLSGLAHLPIPRRHATYLSRDEVASYLREYARTLGLRIVSGTTAKKIHATREGGWRVEVEGGEAWQGRVAVVATGQYRVPLLPSWPGRETYAGSLTHSSSFTNGASYAGKRVLVVGAGNSGAEIATDLADCGAAFVAVSIRTPPAVVLRDSLGIPVQRTSHLLSKLPPSVANVLARLTARLTVGDLTRYGMPRGEFAPYTSQRIPLIDVGFVAALKGGRITLRPALERLTETGAVFADGSEEPFDAIVAATGYTTGLPSLVDVPGALDESGEPRGVSGEPTAHPGLYFIGFTHSLRGHLFEANRASLQLAQNVERYLAARGSA
jgi:putative flavoprotein involved in K+ transport